MDSLSKQQLILLALLISFVTSLATGIVTVSLMNQAPTGVVQTINRIVERTIETAAPQGAAVGSALTFEDVTASSTAAVEKSMVEIKSRYNSSQVGAGLALSASGVIVTDKSVAAQVADYIAVMPSGQEVPVSIVQSEVDGDIVFLAPARGLSPKPVFKAVYTASTTDLGQTVFSLSGTSTPLLEQGIVSSMGAAIITSIPAGQVLPGSPLFDIYGHVLGIRTSSLPTDNGSAFYPIGKIISVAPSI